MQLVSKFEHAILENIDDVFGELVGISLAPLHGGLHFPESYLAGVCQALNMSFKLPH